jgi:DHA2 family lincomycin resistance protein-like MFS transporter
MSTSTEHVRLDPRNRVVLTILLISTFVVFLNETILGVALPQIMDQLHIQASTGQWLSTAYMLTMAIVIPITGFLLQRFTLRVLYVIAMGLFTVGTLLGGLAPDFNALLIARVVQAAGTAVMMPLLMTNVMVLVPEAIRGKIMGTISIVMSVAPAIGPAVSGLALSVFDWRWLFWLILPIAVATLIIGSLRVSSVGETRKVPVDVPSIILSAVGFSGLVYGLSTFADAVRGTALVSPYIPLGVGALVTVIFIVRQTRLAKNDRALLDLRTFRAAPFTIAIILMAIFMMGLFGISILTPIYAQNVLQVTALTTGLLMLPGGLAMSLLGPLVGSLFDRFGARRLIVPGSIAVAIAMWSMVLFDERTWPGWILIVNILMSLGLAFIFTPLFTVSMSSAPPQLYSHASATVGTIQQLAGAAGTALFISVFTAASLRVSKETAVYTDVVASTAAGAHAAFLCGAIIATLALIPAGMIQRPASAEEMGRELQP